MNPSCTDSKADVLKLNLLVKLWEALSSAGRCSLPQQSIWHQLLMS